MSRRSTWVLSGLGAFSPVLIASGSASAAVLGFVEDFSSNSPGWLNEGSLAVTYNTTGGPNGAGDAYISDANIMNRVATTGQSSLETIFRGVSAVGAPVSGDNFVGDFRAAGITEFRAWIKQDNPQGAAMSMGVRFPTTEPGAAFTITFATAIPNGLWTQISIPLVYDPSFATNPNISGGSKAVNEANWNDLFSKVTGIQFNASQSGLPNPTTVTFSLDKVSTVPEPASIGMFGLATGLLALRRRK